VGSGGGSTRVPGFAGGGPPPAMMVTLHAMRKLYRMLAPLMTAHPIYAYAAIAVLVAGLWALPALAQRTKHKTNLDEGERVYRQNCVNCHGPQGKGDGVMAHRLDPKPADLTSPTTRQKKDAELLDVVKFGRPETAMPGWLGPLDEGEIENVLAYVRLLPGHQ
jgi:mono/diheme cytochrome c family protein